MSNWLSRTQLLFGKEAIEVLAQSRVAVFGIGGVGGYAIEALARSGVGAIDVIDDDVVGETNINRQLVATTSSVGDLKINVMAQRVADINPVCVVRAHRCFYLPAMKGTFDFSEFNYVVDAVDTVTAKLQLMQDAHEAKTPIISVLGTANKVDPTLLRVADISKTSICPFARILRKECRKRGIEGVKAVYSLEEPRRPVENADLEEDALRPGRRDVPGSTAFVPPAAGLIAASEVVKDLIAAVGT